MSDYLFFSFLRWETEYVQNAFGFRYLETNPAPTRKSSDNKNRALKSIELFLMIGWG